MSFRRIQLFLMLVVATCSWSSSADPLFGTNSTLIIVSGLPGDLENESLYHEQIQSCLEIARDRPEVHQIFLLCDNPASIDQRSDEHIKISKADRGNFLQLADSLKTQTNPLVVIAFGHGGRQSATNVLHVRGPRLTPQDFTKLAPPAGPSAWVLYFRGSGAFARELAGPGRQILSSDADSAFNSDPIGLSLFLASLPPHPNDSFQSLAAALGAATADWYRERDLARVEEPTFWLPDQKPQLLAQSNSLAVSSSAPSAQPLDAATNIPRSPTFSAEVPPAFKELTPVPPKDYPDDDAITLRRNVVYTIAVKPALTSDHEQFVQVLSAEGKRHADFDVSYSPPAEDITFLDCEVLRPDGKLIRLDPDAIREARHDDVGDYQSSRRKFFSLPGVTPGAILHVRYRTSWKDFPQPYVSLHVPLESELPVLNSQLRITVPKDAAFHWALENITAPDPTISRSDYGISYAWDFGRQSAQPREVLSAPHHTPQLSLSLFPDWQTFLEWFSRISRLADEVTPEIQQQAAELTRDAKNDRDKVLALYNFVTGLRYVAVPLGVNSFRPHAAANVLKNHFGDCKDKANLFNTLLHAVNIPADLVLVPRLSQSYDNLPGFAFNHAISRVTLGKEDLWVDTTDDVCRFGLLPPGDAGRNVLVIALGTNHLVQLPSSQPQDHQLKLHGEIICTNLSEPFPASFSAVGIGYPDYELRQAAREIKARRGSLPLLAARFQPVAGSFALENQSYTTVSSLDENFTWRAQGQCLGLCSVAAGHATLQTAVWLPREWEIALHHRRSPLYLNQGYPLVLEEEIEFSLPKASRSAVLPKMQENTSAPLRWQIDWTNPSAGQLHVQFRAELSTGELSASETLEFQNQLRQLLNALAGAAFLTP